MSPRWRWAALLVGLAAALLATAVQGQRLGELTERLEAIEAQKLWLCDCR